MSKTTIALEAAVATVIENTPKGDVRQTPRQRRNVDCAFATIQRLIAPRIRHFIRQYGLVAHWEDAEQCCAIAIHRAIQAYEPDKAQFTTFINWQIRGELQSLRFRLMTDQRPSAKKVEATTVSLHAVTANGDGEEATLEAIIEDERALALTESGASDYLATAATASLVDAYVKYARAGGMDQLRKRPCAKRVLARMQPAAAPAQIRGVDPVELEKLEQKLARDRDIVERRLFDMSTLDQLETDTGVTKERVRQITKRATKTIAELTASNPRFAVMAEYRQPAALAAPARKRAAAPAMPEVAPVGLLLDPKQPHNRLARVIALDPETMDRRPHPAAYAEQPNAKASRAADDQASRAA